MADKSPLDRSALKAHVLAERRSLAADLADLPAERWQTPSQCADWTVRDVLAHMTATARITPASFFPKFIGSGFNFGRLQTKGVQENLGPAPADTLAGFNAAVSNTSGPPGPPQTLAGETVIHAEDIRRPLGIKHEYPMELVVTLADFFKKSNMIIGSKSRIAGVALRATDADWAHGSGPEAAGPALSLLLAMTGRKAALDDLAGPGVDVLRNRS